MIPTLFGPTVRAALLLLTLLVPVASAASPNNPGTSTPAGFSSGVARDAADDLSFSQPLPDAPLPFLTTSAAPALRLLYTGNTRGALFPCPT